MNDEAMPPANGSALDVVRAFLAAMEKKDYDRALSLVTADCEYDNLPMAKVHGPDAIRGVLEPFFAPTLENEFRVLRSAADGDVVFLERLDRHRVEQGWFELPVTGVWEVRDGRIELWREYFDLATLQKAWPSA